MWRSAKHTAHLQALPTYKTKKRHAWNRWIKHTCRTRPQNAYKNYNVY